MNWSREFVGYACSQFEKRKSAFGGRQKEIGQTLRQCGEDEKLLLCYYYATMPIVDIGDYPPALFLETARHALQVRQEFAWCQELPEHLFLRDVAYPRINTEELEDCRGLFMERLAPRVRGLDLPQAILEVNHWCAEEATYRSTDGRTVSPLQVFRRGFGRCGEESTFLVTALRSVGIAARQVYAPWWSHCDDNHAWVEAFDGTSWRYLGACEPEPVLDRGWFTHAAARATMVHTRSFVQGNREDVEFLFPQTDSLDWDLREGVVTENLTARYGEVKHLSVTARHEDGSPAQNVWVSFAVMNMGAPREIARRRTDSQGEVILRLGKGSLMVTAWQEGQGDTVGEILLSPEETHGEVILGKRLSREGETEFFPPKDAGIVVPSLSQEQERKRQEWLETAGASREEKRRRREQEKTVPSEANQERVWASLTDKDREGDLSQELLEDSLQAFAWEDTFPEEVFRQGLLSPRIGLEVLSPWHKLLRESFTEEEGKLYRTDPSLLWKWVESHVALDQECYSGLWGTPGGMLHTKAGTKWGRALLFCAVCRALGIPSKLVDETPLVWMSGKFRSLEDDSTGYLTISAPESQGALYEQNFTLSRLGEEGYFPVSVGNIEAGESCKTALLPGEYRLWTVSRMPGGNQLARWWTFHVEDGVETTIPLTFRQGDVKDLLEHCPLPEFSLTNSQGRSMEKAEILEKSSLTLLCFLEVGREPTEHLLNELREAAGEYEKGETPLCLVLPDLSCLEDPTLQKALKVLPSAQLWTCDFSTTASPLARRLYLDPDQLPLVVLASQEGEGLYGCCGYNVGTAALLLRLIAGWDEGKLS